MFKLEGILFLRCMFMDNIYRGDIPGMADLWGSALHNPFQTSMYSHRCSISNYTGTVVACHLK